jgi:putative tryptophan/tyrosine transport system substrate-binding protein
VRHITLWRAENLWYLGLGVRAFANQGGGDLLMITRRDFIAGIGAAAWPLAARAQPNAIPVIGFLHPSTLIGLRKPEADAFLRGLAETGYVVGRNVTIENRWAEDHNDRLPALAADLVRLQVAVICPNGAPATLAAKAATQTIPILFSGGFDPVPIGLVASLARPGGNLTGIAGPFLDDVAGKRMELLHELVPAATSIAVLFNPTNLAQVGNLSFQHARDLGVRVEVVDASRQSDIESAFAKMAQQRVGAVMVTQDPLFRSYVDQVAALAVRHAIPAAFPDKEAVKAGGLMSYAPDAPDLVRQMGAYAGRILKGEKPADLPVQRPTKFELVINLKTAKALGLTVPRTLLARADEVIE